jgi:hypothetical protein
MWVQIPETLLGAFTRDFGCIGASMQKAYALCRKRPVLGAAVSVRLLPHNPPVGSKPKPWPKLEVMRRDPGLELFKSKYGL